jgi:hypothetical protein
MGSLQTMHTLQQRWEAHWKFDNDWCEPSIWMQLQPVQHNKVAEKGMETQRYSYLH